MTVLITSYWGESTTEGLRLKRFYDQARDSLEPRFNRFAEGALKVVDREWYSEPLLEHFLVRGRAAEAPADELAVKELVSLLINADNQRAVGTGVAIYGLHASEYAAEINNGIQYVRPRGLRLLANEFSVDNFGGHLRNWMDEAAIAIMAKAKVTASERLIGRLSGHQAETISEERWDLYG
jgi:hypothetical protein